MNPLKTLGKKVLPQSAIYFYHSFRYSVRLGMLGSLLRTLPNFRRKERLGGEAGWTIPAGLIGPDAVCYCIGCGEDITFDLELIDRYGCSIFAFDPTPRAIAHVAAHAGHNPRYHFFEVAIWDKEETVRFYAPPDAGVSHSITNLEGTDTYIEVPAKRLRQVVEAHGHSSIALLKMDIEGAEHTVIRTIVEDRIPIDVLCVEFDELARHATKDRVRAMRGTIRSLHEAGYDLFWIETSNFTFVHRDALRRLAREGATA